MIRVLIIGAGGHALVVTDILLSMAEAGFDGRPVGYLDDDAARLGRRLLGLEVVGTLADLASVPHDAIVIGIGHNETRKRVFEIMRLRGERFASAVHPRSIIAREVEIGQGSMICAGVIINPGSRIGSNVILNTACSIDHHNHVGDHAHIGPGAHLAGEVSVGDGAFIGTGASVIPSLNIGPWSVVGAGSCVIRSVPAGMTVAGVPARVLEGA